MDSISQETLRRVESNDDTLTTLKIKNCNFDRNGRFNSSDGRDFSTLDSSIGENTRMTKLVVVLNDDIALDVTDRGFFEGIKRNSSISELVLNCENRGVVDELVHEILKAYHTNNNLTRLYASPGLTYKTEEILLSLRP